MVNMTMRQCVFMVSAMVCVAEVNAQISASDLPDRWSETDDILVQELPMEDDWWQAFGDATLDSLISVAMQQNLSAEAALNRIEQARTNLYIERGSLLPAVGVSGGWTRQQTSGNVGSNRSWSGQYDLTATMQWELDLFGSIRQRVKAQREQLWATEEEYRGVMVSAPAGASPM